MRTEHAIREAAWLARCLGRGDHAPLAAADVDRLAGSIVTRRLAPGERLFAQGQRPETVWIVRYGEIELVVRTGVRKQVVQVLYPGDVTGDIELLLSMPHAFAARAAEESVVLALDERSFETVLAEHPRIARRWLSSVAGRLATSQRRILHLLDEDLRRKVARLVLDEARDGVVRLPQETLAALLGVRRPSVNKVLRGFEDAGLVELGYRRITVRDAAALLRRAGG